MRVFAPGHELPVAVSRHVGHAGVDVLQVADDLVHGGQERVEVQPVEADRLGGLGVLVGVPGAQPLDKVLDFLVAPHPGRESHEGRATACFLGFSGGLHARAGARAGAPADVAVYGFGVGPVGFDGDDVEAVVFNHVFGQGGAGAVKLGGAVGAVADEEDSAVAETVQEAGEGGFEAGGGGEGSHVGSEEVDGRFVRFGLWVGLTGLEGCHFGEDGPLSGWMQCRKLSKIL